MANKKKVPVINSILTLYSKGWPKLRIAHELGIDVKTVRGYIRKAEEAGATSLLSPTGSEGSNSSTSLLPPAGSEEPNVSTSLVSPTGSDVHGNGRPSQCEPFRKRIEEMLETGLTAQRIHQDLVAEYGFTGAYDAVKRFCRKLKDADPKRIWRMECLPGEEAQIDFGTGYYLEEDGRKRKAHILRVTLSLSRKGYTEGVKRQTAENFIRAIENAFRAFGGVPQTLLLDNLRAAVKKADWYDPELTPKIESFCRHYGTVVLPCRPYTPEHKGKVENAVKYVKDNALKGRTFASLNDLNRHLHEWERTVADTRIHGTTKKQVRKHFEEIDKPALMALPPDLFPCFQEGRRSVHRDSYVEVDGAYYEVPPEYIGQQVWVRWDNHLVRVFNRQFAQIAVLSRQKRGTFSTCLAARGARSQAVERNKAYWLKRCARMGDHCGVWALEVMTSRGAPGVRVLQGLVAMTGKHTTRQVNRACEQALMHSAFRLKDLRRLIEQDEPQGTFPFMNSHPLIRDMQDYAAFLETLYPDNETIKETQR